jgi:hypothetical protein
MPEAAKGPPLWLRRERRDRSGRITELPIRRSGASAMTVDTKRALDAALTIVEGLNAPSPNISPKDRSAASEPARVTHLRSQ